MTEQLTAPQTRTPRRFGKFEGTVVVLGLGFGIVLGVLFGTRSVDEERTTAAVPAPSALEPPADPARERAVLEQRLAELELEKLRERVAQLEAERIFDAGASEGPEFTAAAATAVIETAPPRVTPRRTASHTSHSHPAAAPPAAQQPTAQPPSAAANPGAPTLAYWNRLNDIMAREAAMRAPPANLTAANATAFVESRAQAGTYAAGAIRELDPAGVDGQLVSFSRELAGWYDEEAALNGKAQFLLNRADEKTRKGSEGKSWKGGEEEHRRKCEDLNRRGDLLRGQLSRKYNLAFPDLL